MEEGAEGGFFVRLLMLGFTFFFSFYFSLFTSFSW